jgi:hypothetical protein
VVRSTKRKATSLSATQRTSKVHFVSKGSQFSNSPAIWRRQNSLQLIERCIEFAKKNHPGFFGERIAQPITVLSIHLPGVCNEFTR